MTELERELVKALQDMVDCDSEEHHNTVSDEEWHHEPEMCAFCQAVKAIAKAGAK